MALPTYQPLPTLRDVHLSLRLPMVPLWLPSSHRCDNDVRKAVEKESWEPKLGRVLAPFASTSTSSNRYVLWCHCLQL